MMRDSARKRAKVADEASDRHEGVRGLVGIALVADLLHEGARERAQVADEASELHEGVRELAGVAR
eukprot:6589722-Alexandrium_andersonii.AAC.1